ncbi:MAG: hypothetical protein LBT05_07025 [Planctomycetaceae bacterium]|jgi:hypothetical protein|nr:hypothetical protein [Planctomycetaceae bacterium]
MNFSINLENINFDEPQPEFRSIFRTRSIFYFQTIKNHYFYTIRVRKEFCQLLDAYLPQFIQASEHNWKTSPKENTFFLRFSLPLQKNLDCDQLYNWANFINRYIWLSLNKFTQNCLNGNEMDYCLALDWNYNPENKKDRTVLGEAEYALKYRNNSLQKEIYNDYFQLLIDSIRPAYNFLYRYFTYHNGDVLISPIPLNEQSKSKLAYQLVKNIADTNHCTLLNPVLLQPKPQMKELAIKDKIDVWQNI